MNNNKTIFEYDDVESDFHRFLDLEYTVIEWGDHEYYPSQYLKEFDGLEYDNQFQRWCEDNGWQIITDDRKHHHYYFVKTDKWLDDNIEY